MPRANPADPSSAFVETLFEKLTSYKNRNGGLWGRGELFTFRNMKLADNAIGMTISSGDFGSQRFTSQLVDSLVVGETDNIGNPTTPEEVGLWPQPAEAADPGFPDPRLRILRLPS
jgi:cell migration-inducing and hyaluronan-binding protein